MSRTMLVTVAAAALFTAALAGAAGPLDRAAKSATGFVAHQVCSATFVAGLDPDAYFEEAIAPALGPGAALLTYSIDRPDRSVTARLLGQVETRIVFRGATGCVLDSGGAWPADVAEPAHDPALLPPIAGPGIVLSTNGAIQAAIDRAFLETDSGPHRATKAVVVMHEGKIIAERYALGYGVDTPIHGWSMTKSVTNALLGILVRQGKLQMQEPAPIAAWADPGDPRHAITPDDLLRMQSGLDIGQSLTASATAAFDPTTRMAFAEADMAAFASRAPLGAAPRTEWTYTNGDTLLLSGLIRDKTGGDMESVLRFAHRELFDPLGMEHVTLEFDNAGTPIGASHMWATPRDWARFGQLFLDDGMVASKRILPEGWVDYSAKLTPLSDFYGYGAGFWTNRGDSSGGRRRIGFGMPADAFMARGVEGQYTIIVPSARLVVVRMGYARTYNEDMETVAHLVRDVIAALQAS